MLELPFTLLVMFVLVFFRVIVWPQIRPLIKGWALNWAIKREPGHRYEPLSGSATAAGIIAAIGTRIPDLDQYPPEIIIGKRFEVVAVFKIEKGKYLNFLVEEIDGRYIASYQTIEAMTLGEGSYIVNVKHDGAFLEEYVPKPDVFHVES